MKTVEYKGERLATNSRAYELLTNKKFGELDQHLREVDAAYRKNRRPPSPQPEKTS